jgi:DivIVA domain-containing protein
VGTFLGWVLTALIVGAVAFGVVALVTGRAEPLADMPPDRTPGPPEGPLRPEDVAAARFDLAFRGYRMDQVDALLDRVAAEVAARDEEIAMLRMPPVPDPDRA